MGFRLKNYKFDDNSIKELEIKQGLFNSQIKIKFKDTKKK